MTVTVHRAKTELSKLIRKALDGEEVIIARNDQPVVKLEPIRPKKTRPAFGSMKGLITYMAPDFDEPLEDFREYMEPARPAHSQTKRKRK